MTDSLVPDWIRKIQHEQDQAAIKKGADADRSLLLAKTIQADGPLFWKGLLKELQLTVDGLPKIGVHGELKGINSQEGEAYRISVTLKSALAAQAYTDLFYGGADSKSIFCRPSDEDSFGFNLQFCVYMDRLMVQNEAADRPMLPERAARFIVEPIVQRLLSA
jgi:hypothetical protein